LPPPSFTARHDVLSWGRVTRNPQLVARPAFADELPVLLRHTLGPALATGLHRSYGDSALNARGCLIDMTGLDRFIAFDPTTGVIRAQAGVSLSALLRLTVPRGWFLSTTPGTRFVTLGGAIANDVHGKNHHEAGTLGCSLRALGLLRGDGARLELSPTQNPNLFAATIGGLGLTGVIEWVELQLVSIPSAWLDVEVIPYPNLDAFWELAERGAAPGMHSVAWIDCLARGADTGRGVLTLAKWAEDGRLTPHDDRSWKRLPLEAPGALLNGLTVKAFNELYFRAHEHGPKLQVQHYAKHFYPLDAIRGWNRLYGKRGMLQYQCVVPPPASREAMRALLGEISRSGQASFLAVLKTFGARASPGLLSFPRPGATLALDFPNRGDETLALMARLDAIVREANGALYPAKDGRIGAAMFRQSFPRMQEFLPHKDPALWSDFWERISQ
jgi:FAD/FMN-containing dehydrogenase